MRDYNEDVRIIKRVMKESNLSAYDVMRIAKSLCRCENCMFYVQHYDKDGNYVDYGHCIRNNNSAARRPFQSACGSWDVPAER